MAARVLILGGGFAGIGAARALKKADAEVVVVDKHDYHTFQPLLYQVATDLLERTAVGHPLRDLFHDQPNVRVHLDETTGIDLEKREAQFAEMKPISYDYLVLALGAEVNFFGAEGAPEHAFPMYTLADAIRLKEHILRKWEAADKDSELADDGALALVLEMLADATVGDDPARSRDVSLLHRQDHVVLVRLIAALDKQVVRGQPGAPDPQA